MSENFLQMGKSQALFVNSSPSEKEFFKRITAINSESQTGGLNKRDAADWCTLQTANLLEMLEFGDTTYSTTFLEYALNWLEHCEFSTTISGTTIINILTKVVICDKEKSQQTRVLEIFWNYAYHLPTDLLMCLGKIAIHYTPELGHQELKELMQLVENPETFLHTYSNDDIHKTPFSTDPYSTSLNLMNECVNYWGEKEKNLVKDASSKWADNESVCFLELARLKTAKECLHRLDQTINYMSSDTNPRESHLSASVVRAVMSTEIEALNSMREEVELHHQVADRLHTLNMKHIVAYNALKVEQYERTTEFLGACQKEKDDAVKESIYKKAKCLASIEKARISTDIRLTSKDLLKRIVKKAGGALKEAEGRLENNVNSECALCCSKFCSTRKRACFAPCGHAGACLPCATSAWRENPRCPWCRVASEKPIPLPPKLFF